MQKSLAALPWLLLVLALMFNGTAQAECKYPAKDIPTNTLTEGLFSFPPKVFILGRSGDIHRYPDGLGVSVGYCLGGMTATIYIYDMGIKEIADGVEDPTVNAAFFQSLEEIKVFHNDVEEIIPPTVYAQTGSDRPTFAITLLHAKTKDKKPTLFVTGLYATGFRNKIVKMRLSKPIEKPVSRKEATLMMNIGYAALEGFIKHNQSDSP